MMRLNKFRNIVRPAQNGNPRQTIIFFLCIIINKANNFNCRCVVLLDFPRNHGTCVTGANNQKIFIRLLSFFSYIQIYLKGKPAQSDSPQHQHPGDQKDAFGYVLTCIKKEQKHTRLCQGNGPYNGIKIAHAGIAPHTMIHAEKIEYGNPESDTGKHPYTKHGSFMCRQNTIKSKQGCKKGHDPEDNGIQYNKFNFIPYIL